MSQWIHPTLVRTQTVGPMPAGARPASPDEVAHSFRDLLAAEYDSWMVSQDPTELADLLEVVYSIIRRSGYSIMYIRKVASVKRGEHGSFDQAIVLPSGPVSQQ